MSGLLETWVPQLLSRLIRRHDVEQAFLFGGEGEPFWTARSPLRPDELTLFREAIALIESIEAERPKPFIAHDAARRFAVTAMTVVLPNGAPSINPWQGRAGGGLALWSVTAVLGVVGLAAPVAIAYVEVATLDALGDRRGAVLVPAIAGVTTLVLGTAATVGVASQCFTMELKCGKDPITPVVTTAGLALGATVVAPSWRISSLQKTPAPAMSLASTGQGSTPPVTKRATSNSARAPHAPAIRCVFRRRGAGSPLPLRRRAR